MSSKRYRTVLRFMSYREAMYLLDGQMIENTKDHKKAGNKTNSVGFCFTTGRKGIYEASRYLTGITTTEVCLVGVLPEKDTGFKVGYGVYNKPTDIPDFGDDPLAILSAFTDLLKEIESGKIDKSELQRIKEWSTVTYDLNDFESWGMYEPNEDIDEKSPFSSMIKMSSDRWKTVKRIAGEPQYEEKNRVGIPATMGDDVPVLGNDDGGAKSLVGAGTDTDAPRRRR